MAGINFIGSYSGIDQATIDKLMEAERMPLKQLTNKHVNITAKKDAWKDVNTRLNSLFEKMKSLKNSSTFNSKVATSSDEKFVSMSAGTSAAEGKYNIYVKQLATNSSITGKKVLPPEKIGSEENIKKMLDVEGKFEIKNADKKTIEIEVKKEDSLQSIANKINSSMTKAIGEEGKEGYKAPEKIGIKATVVDNRLVLTDEKTGERTISLENESNGILSKIGLSSTTGWIEDETTGGYGFKKGNQAEFTLNGIKIKRDTNTINDAIEGVVINLNKAHDTGQLDTVNISTDTEKAAKAVQDFVDQYNSTMKFIEEKTAAGDPKVPGSKGILAGESSLIRLQTSLRKLVTDKLTVSGSDIKDASQIGISTLDRFGDLTFDKTKFLDALEKDSESVMNFLSPKEGVGLVDKVNDYINGFISKEDGVIKSQNESLEKAIKDLNSRIESFETRMEKKEKYYIKMFTALDLAMMKAEDQMGWLQGQVDAMNGIKR
ncbi:flagellar filament capping protein FliD [Tissierella creatinophila]|uniref:Flagellar hook-associated protein 2 n=1 Tax=Tissierella creatinophila DSM 6911 TaxID=1123403 RepID=A0A1U7M926_TISCR|nr:flagellar filament capping protein FliD [Tissierella creatinophila]OLS03781.1 flagellar hook-associated protein 2 [Tissierella creatinophila DSM 6911]